MTLENHRSTIQAVARLLNDARSVLFITGAGISADSGLPTYRGIGGLYNGQATDEGVSIETALAGETLRKRPALCWKYIARIELACRAATFNRGHAVIAEIEHSGRFDRVWVLTQNIDGLHHQAESRNIIDIHGDYHHLTCTRCHRQWQVDDYSLLDLPPVCEHCDGPIRPEVVLFGEMLPTDKIATLSRELDRGFDLVFTIGTTSIFPYIAEPIALAAKAGLPTVEINPGTSHVSDIVDYRLPCRAAETLDALWSAANS